MCNRPVRQVAYPAAGPEGTGWELWTGTKPLGPSVVVPRIACAPAFSESSAAHLGAKMGKMNTKSVKGFFL